jgi:hypothetical protein
LRFAGGFHDPDVSVVLHCLHFAELVGEEDVLVGEDVGLGVEVVSVCGDRYSAASLGLPSLSSVLRCFLRFLTSWSFLQSS